MAKEIKAVNTFHRILESMDASPFKDFSIIPRNVSQFFTFRSGRNNTQGNQKKTAVTPSFYHRKEFSHFAKTLYCGKEKIQKKGQEIKRSFFPIIREEKK